MPPALAVDADVRPAVAVEVPQHGDVPRRAAEAAEHRRLGVAPGADVPEAVAVDDEVGAAVAVDVAGERHVARRAAEHVDVVGRAVEVAVDEPGAARVQQQRGAAGAVDVGGERRAVDAGIEVEVGVVGAQHPQQERRLGLGTAGPVHGVTAAGLAELRRGQRAIEAPGERQVPGAAVGVDDQLGRRRQRPCQHVPVAVAEHAVIGTAVAVPVDGEGPVGRGASQPGNLVDDAVAVEIDQPLAGAVDDPVGRAVAVDVRGQRDVARGAEIELAVRHAGAAVADVPLAVAEDGEVDVAVAVEVAHQRRVPGYATEHGDGVGDAVEIVVDAPDAGAVGHEVVEAVAVHVGGEHPLGETAQPTVRSGTPSRL